MLKFLRHLRKSDFVRNISIVFSGTALAQIIGLALTPIISRLFDKSDFGVFGSFMSVLSIVAAGVTLQYSSAVMLPKKDEDAANVFGLSVLSVIFISFAGLIFAYIYSDWLLARLESPQSRWLLWFLPLGILVAGLNESFQGWCVRRKSFKRTGASQVIRAGSSNTFQIATGLLKYGGSGLICSSVAANGIASLNLGHQVFVIDKKLLKHSFAWSKMRKLAVEYRDFPIYAASDNVMNAISQGLPVLLLIHFYGSAIAGAYAFGIRLLKVPMNFVLTALRQVLFQKASETYNAGGKLLPLYIKLTLGLFAIAIIPALILILFAPQLFSWVFGQEWYLAGEYARWMIFWLVPMFCNVPSVLFAKILRQQRNMFLYSVVVLACRALTLVIGGYYLSALNTVILFSITGAVLNIFLILCIGIFLIVKENRIIH